MTSPSEPSSVPPPRADLPPAAFGPSALHPLAHQDGLSEDAALFGGEPPGLRRARVVRVIPAPVVQAPSADLTAAPGGPAEPVRWAPTERPERWYAGVLDNILLLTVLGVLLAIVVVGAL